MKFPVILTGDSFPRLSAWHQHHENNWTNDTPGQFAGMLHWLCGSPDSTASDEFPALHLFPQYAEALRTPQKAP